MGLGLAIRGTNELARAVLRAWHDHFSSADIRLLAIGGVDDVAELAHGIRYEPAGLRWPVATGAEGHVLWLGERKVVCLAEGLPVPPGTDILIDCDPLSVADSRVRTLLAAGQPGADALVLHGVNARRLETGMQRVAVPVLPLASCAPVLARLGERVAAVSLDVVLPGLEAGSERCDPWLPFSLAPDAVLARQAEQDLSRLLPVLQGQCMVSVLRAAHAAPWWRMRVRLAGADRMDAALACLAGVAELECRPEDAGTLRLQAPCDPLADAAWHILRTAQDWCD